MNKFHKNNIVQKKPDTKEDIYSRSRLRWPSIIFAFWNSCPSLVTSPLPSMDWTSWLTCNEWNVTKVIKRSLLILGCKRLGSLPGSLSLYFLTVREAIAILWVAQWRGSCGKELREFLVQQLKDLNPVNNLPLDSDLPPVEPPDEATVRADSLNSGDNLESELPS